jgi:hypothetical protein
LQFGFKLNSHPFFPWLTLHPATFGIFASFGTGWASVLAVIVIYMFFLQNIACMISQAFISIKSIASVSMYHDYKEICCMIFMVVFALHTISFLSCGEKPRQFQGVTE